MLVWVIQETYFQNCFMVVFIYHLDIFHKVTHHHHVFTPVLLWMLVVKEVFLIHTVYYGSYIVNSKVVFILKCISNYIELFVFWKLQLPFNFSIKHDCIERCENDFFDSTRYNRNRYSLLLSKSNQFFDAVPEQYLAIHYHTAIVSFRHFRNEEWFHVLFPPLLHNIRLLLKCQFRIDFNGMKLIIEFTVSFFCLLT